jgi:pyridinium-3,5-biscarboxylic acid mononucleotide sulfurtransferase
MQDEHGAERGTVALPSEVWDHLSDPLRQKFRCLWQTVSRFDQIVVAFSGGVDSALVAAICARLNPNRTLLVTAESPSLSLRQREIAARVALELNLPHRWLETAEASDPLYQRNHRDRCYYCKSYLYAALESIALDYPNATILNGTNHDDLSDFRPGLQAAAEHRIRAPLADAGLTKSDVRSLAQLLKLSVHDLPAAPCLASRLAYGVPVTRERLRRVEQAEHLIWQAGFSDVRVRVLAGEVARVEVPQVEVPRLRNWLAAGQAEAVRTFAELGFAEVHVAAEGLISGNLNTRSDTDHTGTLPKLRLL